MEREHICEADKAVCPCGRKWDYQLVLPSGARGAYTDADCAARYRAIYGGFPFETVAR